MSRVLIIGAGGVGAVVARKCAQVPEVFSKVCIASRTVSKCRDLRNSITAARRMLGEAPARMAYRAMPKKAASMPRQRPRSQPKKATNRPATIAKLNP